VRERRNYLILMGAIAAAVVGALLLAIPGSPVYKKPTKGLDLQGGIEVILRAVPDKGQHLTQSGMQTAQQVINQRVNKLGLSSPNVALQGNNEIVVQLAGVHDPNKAAKIIGTTGKLYFFDFEKDLAAPTVSQGQPAPVSSLHGLLTAVKGQAKKNPSAYYLFKEIPVEKKVTKTVKGKKVTKTQKTTKYKKLQGPDPNLHQLLLSYDGKQPPNTQILAVPANRLAMLHVIAGESLRGSQRQRLSFRHGLA